LRDELAKVPGKIDTLMGTLNDFMNILKEASEEESAGAAIGPEVMKPVADKLGEMIEQNKKQLEANQTMLTALETIDKRLKRIYMGFAGMYRR
jgi:hypothetical protein